MSNLDNVIEQLFARSLDGNAKIKDDLVGTVIMEKKVTVISSKAVAVLEIENKLSESKTSAGKAALEACLAAIVKA